MKKNKKLTALIGAIIAVLICVIIVFINCFGSFSFPSEYEFDDIDEDFATSLEKDLVTEKQGEDLYTTMFSDYTATKMNDPQNLAGYVYALALAGESLDQDRLNAILNIYYDVRKGAEKDAMTAYYTDFMTKLLETDFKNP